MEGYAFIPEAMKPGMIEPLNSQKTNYILEQQKLCCGKVLNGTGFFCKLVLPHSLKILPVFITCNHVLNEEKIKSLNEIEVSLNDGNKNITIKMDKSKIIYTNPDLDVTIIQMRYSEYPELNTFLAIDEDALKENSYQTFKEKSIHLLQYPKGISKYSFGTIKAISEEKYIIQHSCASEYGSSGGPLINSINMKLIGIHTGSIPNKIYNKGIFIKPIIKDFFKYLEGKKIYYDEQLEKEDDFVIRVKNEFNDSTKFVSNKVNINDNALNKNFNYSLFGIFVFFMGFILGICFNILIEFCFEFNKDSKEDIYHIIIIIIYDMICGTALKLTECFLNHKLILSLSLILVPLYYYEHVLTRILLPYFVYKLVISSFFYVLPFLNEEIIYKINLGEIISNIIYIYISLSFDEKENPDYYQLLYILISIICILCIIYLLFHFRELEILKKNAESNFHFSENYLDKNTLLICLLFINFSFTFSTMPIFAFKFVSRKFVYIFIFSDAIGRFCHKIFNENFYYPLIFFRFVISIYLWFAFDENKFYYILLTIVLGLFSGILTSMGYYIPVKKKEEEDRLNLFYYIKKGKYYALYIGIENNRKKQLLTGNYN